MNAGPQIIGVREMRERFALGPRRARALLRRMKHLCEGRDIWTTEQWLAEWCASQAVPGKDWPDFNRDREPIDEDVVQRAVELVGKLAERGAVRIVNL
jgi:hypothetical protein